MQPNAFARYLTAKRTVDDRALNRHVWEHLRRAVQARQTAIERPLRVLELGGGVGTMVERMVTWALFSTVQQHVHYTLLDADPALQGVARQHLSDLPNWLRVEFVAADALEYAALFLEGSTGPRFDLVIASAFLDLLDLDSALPVLRALLHDDGLFYFPINFDGATLLQPVIDSPMDAAIETAYHCTMDERKTGGRPSGNSRTGRHLFSALPASGFEIHAAGSSDWVVFPIGGIYPADEATFLHFIVDTIDGALREEPPLDRTHFAAWVATRHAQIECGELTYIAHQLDFCGAARHL